MKLGLISDLHLYKKTRYTEAALLSLRDADIILLAGDFINDGSICPTTATGNAGNQQPGNFTIIELDGKSISIAIHSIRIYKS